MLQEAGEDSGHEYQNGHHQYDPLLSGAAHYLVRRQPEDIGEFPLVGLMQFESRITVNPEGMLPEHQVGQQTAHDGQDKEHRKEYECLTGNHGQHDEGLVPRGGDHGRHQRAHADDAVRVQRHRGEPAYASGYESEQGPCRHLTQRRALQTAEPPPCGSHVDILYHDHHHHDQAGDEISIEHYIPEQMPDHPL